MYYIFISDDQEVQINELDELACIHSEQIDDLLSLVDVYTVILLESLLNKRKFQ